MSGSHQTPVSIIQRITTLSDQWPMKDEMFLLRPRGAAAHHRGELSLNALVLVGETVVLFVSVDENILLCLHLLPEQVQRRRKEEPFSEFLLSASRNS